MSSAIEGVSGKNQGAVNRPTLIPVTPGSRSPLPRLVLTLQQVGHEEGRRGVRAAQTLLQEVSLQLQGKQVPRREFKTPQILTPKVLEHAPLVSVTESTCPPEAAATGDVRAVSKVTSGPSYAAHTAPDMQEHSDVS